MVQIYANYYYKTLTIRLNHTAYQTNSAQIYYKRDFMR